MSDKKRAVIGAQRMREIATKVHDELPEAHGFLLITFPFRDYGLANYISTGDRTDILKMLKQTVEAMENGRILKTPEEN